MKTIHYIFFNVEIKREIIGILKNLEKYRKFQNSWNKYYICFLIYFLLIYVYIAYSLWFFHIIKIYYRLFLKKIPNAFKLFRGSVHAQYEQIKKKKVSSLFNLFRLPLDVKCTSSKGVNLTHSCTWLAPPDIFLNISRWDIQQLRDKTRRYSRYVWRFHVSKPRPTYFPDSISIKYICVSAKKKGTIGIKCSSAITQEYLHNFYLISRSYEVRLELKLRNIFIKI